MSSADLAPPFFGPPPEPPSARRRLAEEIAALRRSRELLRHLVSADLRKRNERTWLGNLWWVVDPLLYMGVYVLVIHVMLRRGGAGYPVYVFSAILFWRAFTAGAQGAMGITVGRLPLMKQALFPRSVYPLAHIITEMFHLLFGVVILIVIAVPFGYYPTPYVPLLVLPVAVTGIWALGIGLLLATANVFVRDISNATHHVFRIGFYLSPGLYKLSDVPSRYRTLFELNPFTQIYESGRDIVIYHTLPPLGLAGAAGAGLVVLTIGALVFARAAPSFTKVG